ncbi:MAG: 4Fe-4S dicluster domain-containing protein [archaeon]|nr:4Fe-4S dicluster domain-containing protein [archaeon]
MSKKQKLDLKPNDRNTPLAKKAKRFGKFLKLPLLKQLFLKKQYPDGTDNQLGMYIPVNLNIGSYENQIIPRKVAEYFIKKAGTILIIDCPCRITANCENHEVSLGCTWMGEGTKHIDFSKYPFSECNPRFVTVEEALEHERIAYENGLIPAFGKLRGDAEHYGVLDYEDQFMDICHCCTCCCMVGLNRFLPSEARSVVKRMPGVTVKVDQDICVGCAKCFKVCIFGGLKYDKKNSKTSINQDNCLGCGRCASTCPNEAISITIDDYDRIEEVFKGFDSRVDISG